MGRFTRAAAAALAALAAAACTDDDASPPDTRAAVEAIDGFASALATEMCSWQFRCCSLPEIDAIGGSSYLTAAECRSATELGLQIWLGEARAAAVAGHLTMDAAVAQSCVHSFDQGSCSSPSLPQDPWVRFGACADPFVGKVPAGAPCRLRSECAAGSRCVAGGHVIDTGMVQTPEGLNALPTVQSVTFAPGFCLPYVAEGDFCRTTGDCAPGLYCRPDTFVCARPAAEGEACQPASTTGLPTPVIPCDDARSSLVCLGDVCGRLPHAGEPCIADGIRPTCDPDPSLALNCVGQRFNGTGVCEPLGKSGEPCGGDGLTACEPDLACLVADSSTGVGACGPLPGLGEPCGFPSACGAGTVCDADTATCVRGQSRHDGAACSTGGDCASLTCLETGVTRGVCTLPLLQHFGCTGVTPAGMSMATPAATSALE